MKEETERKDESGAGGSGGGPGADTAQRPGAVAPPVAARGGGGVYRRHLWALLVPLGLALAGVLAATVQHGQRFRSEAVVMLRRAPLPWSGEPEAGTGGHAHFTLADERTVAAEVEVLRSRDLARAAAEDVGFESLTGGKPGLGWSAEAAKIISDQLEVYPVEGAPVVRLAFSHRDPAVAKQVLETFVEGYFQQRASLILGSKYRDVVRETLEVQRGKLASAEAEERRLRAEARIADSGEAHRASAEQLEKLGGAVLETQVELAGLRVLVQQLGEAGAAGAPDGDGGAQAAERLREAGIQLAAVEARLEALIAAKVAFEEEQASRAEVAGRIEGLERLGARVLESITGWERLLDRVWLVEASDHAFNPHVALIQHPTEAERVTGALRRQSMGILAIASAVAFLLPWLAEAAGQFRR